jgi:4-hydroxy-2-oxoheptanedioate aldolase
MRPNRLRELLNADKPSLGTHVHSPWPSVIEMVGQTGMYDYVEYVAEYAPYDLHTMENLGRAVELFDDFTSMIKVEQSVRGYLASRAMGSGIQNLLFADLRSVEDVEECVAAVRAEMPGKGQHGWNMRRYVSFGKESMSEFVTALDDVVVAVMIEKEAAVKDLEALLSVPGVDMVQFGPSDYSLSIGHPGDYGNPKVKEAEAYVIKTALEMGKNPRAELGSAEGAKRYLDMGVKHFCVGTDVSVLMKFWREDGEEMRKLLE